MSSTGNVIFYLNVPFIQYKQKLESLNYDYTDMMMRQQVWYILEIGSRSNTCHQEVFTLLQGPWGGNLRHSSFLYNRLWPLPFRGKREEFPCKDQYPCVTLNHPAVSISQLCQSPWYNASLQDSWFPSIVAARVNYPTWQLRFSNILLVAVSINEHTAARYTYSTHEQTCWQQLPMPQGLVFIKKNSQAHKHAMGREAQRSQGNFL